MKATTKPACAAVLWNSGRRCKAAAQSGAQYCNAHLSLLAPLDWTAGDYAPGLDPATRLIFRQAAFITLTDELALARVQLRALLHSGASANQVVGALRVLAMLVRLQNHIDRTALQAATKPPQ